jgi:HEAT repeat protein
MLKNQETAGIACLALGSHPSPKANEVLRQALARTRDMVRVQIIVTLGDRRDAEAVSALIPLTRNADGPTAENAIGSLGKIATPAALAALKDLREKGDPALARAAWQATLVSADLLSRSGERTEAAALYKEIMGQTYPDYARRAAFEGSLRMNPSQSRERISEVLNGNDDALKPSALAAVQNLQGEDVSAAFAREMAGLKPEHQVLLIQALAKRHDAPAMEAITKAVSSENAIVRRAAVEALGRSGDAASVK